MEWSELRQSLRIHHFHSLCFLSIVRLLMLRAMHPVQVAVYQLAMGDECLVLSSEGLVSTVSPQEMATLLNHFDSGTLTMLQCCYLNSPPPAAPGSRPVRACKCIIAER